MNPKKVLIISIGLIAILGVVLFFASTLRKNPLENDANNSSLEPQEQKDPTITVMPPETFEPSRPQEASPSKRVCNETECLTIPKDGEIYGTATLSGYYSKSVREAWGQKSLCDEFVIVGGSETVKDYFGDLVDAGNTVNRKDADGRPVITINPNELNSTDRNKLIAATPRNTISLFVELPIQRGTGAPVCYSFVTLKGVK